MCKACGNDGQTYCVIDPRNVEGNWKCDDGTRLDDASNTCVACGKSGQTHCFADARNISGNWSCDAGLTYDTWSAALVPSWEDRRDRIGAEVELAVVSSRFPPAECLMRA